MEQKTRKIMSIISLLLFIVFLLFNGIESFTSQGKFDKLEYKEEPLYLKIFPIDFFGDWNHPEIWYLTGNTSSEYSEVVLYEEPPSSNYTYYFDEKMDGIGYLSFKNYTSNFNTAIANGYEGFYDSAYREISVDNMNGFSYVDGNWNFVTFAKYIEDWIVWNWNTNLQPDNTIQNDPENSKNEDAFSVDFKYSFLDNIFYSDEIWELDLQENGIQEKKIKEIYISMFSISGQKLLQDMNCRISYWFTGNDATMHINDEYDFFSREWIFEVPSFQDRLMYKGERYLEKNKQSLYEFEFDDELSQAIKGEYSSQYTFYEFKNGVPSENIFVEETSSFEYELLKLLNQEYVAMYDEHTLGRDRLTTGFRDIEDLRYSEDVILTYTDQDGNIIDESYDDVLLGTFDSLNVNVKISESSLFGIQGEEINIPVTFKWTGSGGDITEPIPRDNQNLWIYILIPTLVIILSILVIVIFYLYKKQTHK